MGNGVNCWHGDGRLSGCLCLHVRKETSYRIKCLYTPPQFWLACHPGWGCTAEGNGPDTRGVRPPCSHGISMKSCQTWSSFHRERRIRAWWPEKRHSTLMSATSHMKRTQERTFCLHSSDRTARATVQPSEISQCRHQKVWVRGSEKSQLPLIERHSYSFGDELMQTDPPLVLWCAGLHL